MPRHFRAAIAERRPWVKLDSMNRARLGVLAVLLVASVVASSSGFARAQFFCRMSGQIGRACCCAKHTPKAKVGTVEVRSIDCCQVVVGKSAERAVTEPPAG